MQIFYNPASKRPRFEYFKLRSKRIIRGTFYLIDIFETQDILILPVDLNGHFSPVNWRLLEGPNQTDHHRRENYRQYRPPASDNHSPILQDVDACALTRISRDGYDIFRISKFRISLSRNVNWFFFSHTSGMLHTDIALYQP